MKRDVSADRHDTWGGDAMAAYAASDERGGRGRRNRVVPIPRRWAQACGMAMSALTGPTRRAGDGGYQARTPGRARISRKTIAQGMSVVPAALSLLACAKCTFLCTQGSRGRPASGIPCALFNERAIERCI